MIIDGNLRSIFREKLPAFHWTTIETGGTTLGIPDSNYCLRGVEGWVEYKATDGWAVELRPEQQGWLSRRGRAGGRAHVAVRRWHSGGPRKGPAVDELWMLWGWASQDIRKHGLDQDQPYFRGMWTGGPASWCWDSVARHLLEDVPDGF